MIVITAVLLWICLWQQNIV